MKKIILLPAFFLLLLGSKQLHAQQSDSLKNNFPEGTKEYYQLESKHQKTSAWFMLGSGLLLAVAGGIEVGNNLFTESNEGASLFLVGAGLSLGSVPLFIASGRNKRRASLAVSAPPVSFHSKVQPAFTLKLTLPVGK
jgi:hypothetical protein